jgi:GTP-binding protein HflX
MTKPVTEAPAIAVVIVPLLSDARMANANSEADASLAVPRSAEARIEEAVGLAQAIDLDVAFSKSFKLSELRPSTLLGKGMVEQIAAEVEERDIGLVIIDHSLSPVQQRNLERALKTKVIDRTGLILEIFGRRAKTREGVLQVDLAHLTYQKGRLVRSWTHLERQRGGGGFMGGPGETQIEADRRLLQGRIDRLKAELVQVMQTRKLHRAKRQKVPYPVVALVGYTNAGKSTLFNRLTGAGVMAADMLFATLDPTLRRLKLPHGGTAILSDTVGFISNLPTHLVAAFRATLEEVVEADLIIHVRDIADPDTQAQAKDVEAIMRSLDLDPQDSKRIIEVWNKIDLLDAGHLAAIQSLLTVEPAGPRCIAISAVTGQGLDELLRAIEVRVEGVSETVKVRVPVTDMTQIDWIYRNGNVLERKHRKDGSVDLKVHISHAARNELAKRLKSSKL